MFRVSTLVLVALAITAAHAFTLFNVNNLGGNTYVPGGKYKANGPCRKGSLVGRITVLLLQQPSVEVEVTGTLHNLKANGKSQLTDFEAVGTWGRLDETETDIFNITGSNFTFTFQVDGVTFTGVYVGQQLGNATDLTIVSSSNCTQRLSVTNNFLEVQNWGSPDNSSQDVGDNAFEGVFRGPEAHLLIDFLEIQQNKKGLVSVKGHVLVPTNDYEDVVIKKFTVNDDDVKILVSFAPSATEYQFDLPLDLDADPNTIDAVYSVAFFTPNLGEENEEGAVSTTTVSTVPEVVVVQPFKLIQQTNVSIVEDGSLTTDI